MNRDRPKVIYLFGRPPESRTRDDGPEGLEKCVEREEEIHDRASLDGEAEADAAQPSGAARERSDGRGAHRRLMTETYSAVQAGRMLGIPVGRVRYWARCGLIAPTGRRGATRFYTFQDLVGLRVARGLLDAGLSTRRVRRAVVALRSQLPRHSRPLAELRIYSDGDAVIVREGERPFEAESGQMVLDFSVEDLQKQIVELAAPPKRAGREERKSAFEWYQEGLEREATPETFDDAEHAYRRAIELDPELACAYTNLGNLRYRAGAVEDAEVLYRKALELETDQPEAFYNLGYLAYEDARTDEAVTMFRRAVELAPDFGDAHFNLAMALHEEGDRQTAKKHFLRYLELHPSGAWAEVARQHLAGRS